MKLPRRKVWALAGEAQINDDGTSRQKVLAVLEPGEPVTLQRQPDNPFDPNAIAVLAGRHQIGFISRVDAVELAPLLDAQVPHRAQLHELTGGMPGYPNFGAKICIAWRDHQMLTPLPLTPEQTRHLTLRTTRSAQKGDEAADQTGGNAGIQIGIVVAVVVACIAVAALL